ncbi:hypothetical protein J3R03_002778 [Actinoplanes couchii]|uniref:MmyB-like transcription regulator ligand binding domain-containing protein n=1 Tax=Actinoplanes couchii TaxID=403638 RepID=A0ABQ3XNW1_9ACTN|nr:hypothetical protein [Actinoplanes couchii]GID60191.1 hypothetical protein Aco03nite_085950 [Actinoplanes couchii]
MQLQHSGTKVLRHPIAGEMTLTFTAMQLPLDPGLTINAYTAEPGSASEEKLQLLASWSAPSAPDRLPADTETPLT